ncbi:ferredoxin-NADP reductase [Mycetocola sp. CAN_C7]|uniref:FAD-binding oxidoreductase n=1 Tax=Mycetocola sp. CAN_C7 TaxID=2787724 RepID=UPI0018CAD77F
MTSGATWHIATVATVRPLTPNASLITLGVPTWPGNDGGQHIDVRLTAEGGYQATRSYSLASVGNSTRLELAVDRVPDGEVSPYLVDDLRPDDQLEIQGPLGGWFVWKPSSDLRPVQLIAGGSGVVPCIGMLRAHSAAQSTTPMRLLYGLRTPEDLFFADELKTLGSANPAAISLVFSRLTPEHWPDPPGRLSRDSLAAHTIGPEQRPRLFVCGSTGFVETVLSWLTELGHGSTDIRAERFGGI